MKQDRRSSEKRLGRKFSAWLSRHRLTTDCLVAALSDPTDASVGGLVHNRASNRRGMKPIDAPRIAGAAASMLRLLSTGVISSRLGGRELGMAIRRWLGALTAMGAALGFSMTAQAGPTLDKVKQAGQISCLMYAMPIR